MPDVSFDIVVVGSGAGGGTVAKELAPLCAEGARVAVFEWGAKLRDDELTGREVEMAHRLFFDSGGMLTKDRAMTLAAGRTYGGSTVVYTGTSLTIPLRVVERWQVPGLEWEDIERRSAKYAAENNVHLLGPRLHNDNNRLFVDGCRALGWRAEQFPINVDGCRGAGLCNLGCPNLAKQGTHRVQLPAAEQAGVEVITNAKVERIGDRECRVTVRNPGFGEPSPWAPGEYRVRSKVVVVAGNAVQSSALLLRSGLGARLPALGRYLTLHPALILAGEHERSLSNFVGHPKSFYCDEFLESDRFLLETCMYFPFTTAKNLIGFGNEHSELMRAFPRMQQILVLAIDPAREDNRITVDKRGDPVVDYRLTGDVLDALHRSMIAAAEVFFAAGARRVHAPAGERFFIPADKQEYLDKLILRRNVRPGQISITSAHLMGGCRMGADPATSVTDAWGQVHGVPWLFVADSSLFPRCSEVNPYLTVMALAGRVAERVSDRFKELSTS
jgi:choline dehydrogenase-like flavoprotein